MGPEEVVAYDQHAHQGRAASLRQAVCLFVWRQVEPPGRLDALFEPAVQLLD